jgi:hypothetical protein
VGTEKTFNDIFVKQLLKDLWPGTSSNPPSDIQDSSPAHMAYLMGELEIFSTPSLRGQSHYNQVKMKPAPRTPHVFTEEQRAAFQFFKKYIPDLSEAFSPKELKRAFRLLARRFHPDMGAHTEGALFHELKKAYLSLNSFP